MRERARKLPGVTPSDPSTTRESVRRYTILLVVFAVSLSFLPVCNAQEPGPTRPADRVARWRQDLKFFADEFPTRHIDFEKLYPRVRFDGELARLQADIPELSDAQITLRLMRLIASANVAHTRVFAPTSTLGFHRVPLSFHWYSDGLAVISATPDYTAALGTHVLRVGSMTPEQLLTALAPYIPYENDVGLQDQSTALLESLKVLQEVGAADPDGRITFRLVKPGGQPFTLTVAAVDPSAERVSFFEALHVPPALYRKQPDSYYWYEYLADSRTLYIQYNRCQIDPKLPFKDFVRDLLAFADSHSAERVIIDLRFNGGGNSIVIYPLWAGLKARPHLSSNVFVLIGPGTFSSAQDNAVELRRQLGATLVGEPTGEKPNSYGEVRQFTLPNSGLKVQYCTKFFRMADHGDPSALEPDVRVPRTLADVLAGRDPVIETAIKYSRSKN